jgi:hypothetical protein
VLVALDVPEFPSAVTVVVSGTVTVDVTVGPVTVVVDTELESDVVVTV